MGEEPEGAREIRDSTGFVVGSPDWLEVQRRIDRRETSSDLQRQGIWYVALGGFMIAISLFTTLTVLTSDDSLGFKLTPAGYLAVSVAPLLVGAAAIAKGLRQRGGGPKDVLTSLPPSPRTPADPSAPSSEAGSPEQP